MIITIKEKDLPKKINEAELEASIKAIYGDAKIEVQPERYLVTPASAGSAEQGRSFGAEIVITVDDNADADVIKQAVAAHAPEHTEAEKAKLDSAKALFDLLMLDSRFSKIQEGGKNA